MRENRPIGRSVRWIWSMFFILTALACLSGVAGAAACQSSETISVPASSSAVFPVPSPNIEEIDRGMTVYVDCASGFYEITMTQGTVGDALTAVGQSFDGDDRITPASYILLEDGMRIEAVSVETRTRTEIKTIEYETVKKKDSTLEKGQTTTQQKGENGSETLTYEDVYENGELVESSLASTEVTKKSVSEILLVGTKVVDRTVSVSAEITLSNDNRADKDPPKESDVEKVVYVQATAYTHTGNKTATGVMPYVGMIAVNPKQIPYGTKLYVEGYGYGVAGDTGGFRFSDRFQIDLFMDTYQECMNWGRRNNVKVYILK